MRLGTGTGTFGSATSYAAESQSSRAVKLGDLNNDGFLDLITAGRTDANAGAVTIRLGNGSGTFGSSISYNSETTNSNSLEIGDVNNDGALDIVSAGIGGGGYMNVFIGNNTGTFAAGVSYAMDTTSSVGLDLADINGDGNLDAVTAGNGGGDGTISIRLGTGSGTFGTRYTYLGNSEEEYSVSFGDLNGDGVLDMVSQGYSSPSSHIVRLGNSDEGVAPILPLSLKTRSGARHAITMLEQKQEQLSIQRGIVGGFQARASVSIANLTNSKENYLAAESRIRDADIAQESANMVRLQILQNASTSVLAQANQQPSLALRLLNTE